MLTELRVRDLAVIADVTLPFQAGLNVLTGETGAGKSMVVDALALLLGERASADVVRPGADKTIIEGAFEFASAVHRHLLTPFAALGVEIVGLGPSSVKAPGSGGTAILAISCWVTRRAPVVVMAKEVMV